MTVGKISGACRQFMSSVGEGTMSRPKFSLRQRPKEELGISSKQEVVKPEEAKASSMDYSNFGSGNITVSLGISQENSLTKPSLSKILPVLHNEGEINKPSDNIHKSVYMSLPSRNVFFDFLSQIIGKQKKGLTEIYKGNSG